MTLKENLLNALYGKTVDRVPVVSVTQTGIVELMDKVNTPWPESHTNTQKMADLAVSAFEIAGLEAVRLPYCLTVLAEAMGCKINIGTKNRQPYVVAHPYETIDQLENIKIPNLKKTGRIPIVLEAIKISREKIGFDVPIIAGMEGPVTLASDMVSIKTFMKWSIKNTEALSKVLKYATKAAIEYANLMVEAGADIICIADPVSSPDLISPQNFHDKLMGSIIEFSDNVNAPVILHICGNVTSIIEYMADCHCKGLSIEEKVTDLVDAKYKTHGKAVLIGNVSSTFVLLSVDSNKVIEATKKALENNISILAPGCGILPMTPLENIKTMVQTRNDYYK